MLKDNSPTPAAIFVYNGAFDIARLYSAHFRCIRLHKDKWMFIDIVHGRELTPSVYVSCFYPHSLFLYLHIYVFILFLFIFSHYCCLYVYAYITPSLPMLSCSCFIIRFLFILHDFHITKMLCFVFTSKCLLLTFFLYWFILKHISMWTRTVLLELIPTAGNNK